MDEEKLRTFLEGSQGRRSGGRRRDNKPECGKKEATELSTGRVELKELPRGSIRNETG